MCDAFGQGLMSAVAHLAPHCKAQEASQPPQDHVDDAADAEEDLQPCHDSSTNKSSIPCQRVKGILHLHCPTCSGDIK